MAAQRLNIYAQKEDIYVVHNQYISAQGDTGIAGDCTSVLITSCNRPARMADYVSMIWSLTILGLWSQRKLNRDPSDLIVGAIFRLQPQRQYREAPLLSAARHDSSTASATEASSSLWRTIQQSGAAGEHVIQ